MTSPNKGPARVVEKDGHYYVEIPGYNWGREYSKEDAEWECEAVNEALSSYVSKDVIQKAMDREKKICPPSQWEVVLPVFERIEQALPPSGEPEEVVQRQDSLTDQMRDVHKKAVEIGCYDAADFIKERFFRKPEKGEGEPKP